jgi:hypothetical protein
VIVVIVGWVAETGKSFVMTRTVLVLSAALIVLAAGLVHGTWTHRWQDDPALDDAAARLARVPTKAGGWTAGEAELIPPDELRSAGARACWKRSFTSADTGQKVLVILLCGPTGKMCAHRPESCYPGQGYDLTANPLRYPVQLPDLPPQPSEPAAQAAAGSWAEFRTARFARPEVATGGSQLRIFWAWNAAGRWQAPENPRWTFAPQTYLYKLYVIRALPPRPERAEEDPAADFLRHFLPELTRALAPA